MNPDSAKTDALNTDSDFQTNMQVKLTTETVPR